MGNVNMEATQINYRGGSKKMSVEEAIKAAGTEITPEEKTWIDSIPTLDNEVNGDATVYPYADVITIPDAVPANLADCNVKIEPVQDLHGYDKPWVGGAGKNKCAGTYTTTTNGGVTFTANSDGTVSATDTSSGYAYVNSSEFTIKAGAYIFSGAPSGNSKYVLAIYSGATLISQISNGTETSVTFESDTNIVVRCVVNGADVATGVTYKPMIRLSTETDATFAPYTNICPITGHTEASVELTDGDETTKTYTIALGDTIYGGSVRIDSNGNTVMDVDRVKFTPTSAANIGKNTAEWPTNQFNIFPSDSESAKANGHIISDRFKTIDGGSDVGVFVSSNGRIRVNTTNSYQSASDALAGEFASSEFCYELAAPTTIQLTPQQIQLLKGTNTLTASTGQISVTVNGVSGAIGAVQTQANNTDEALAELAEQLPTAPTTDGAYVLTVTVADGTPTYSWESAT